MTNSIQELPPHPAIALLPPLEVMESLGYERRACPRGTGVIESRLFDPGARISLQQELRFYRNALDLTGDPVIGLKLGALLVPQRYALLSAETLGHALAVAQSFGRLSFSFFDLYLTPRNWTVRCLTATPSHRGSFSSSTRC